MLVGRTLWNRRVRLRDGVEASADVILPRGEGPFPTVVLRTPYVSTRQLNRLPWTKLVDSGYARCSRCGSKAGTRGGRAELASCLPHERDDPDEDCDDERDRERVSQPGGARHS